MASLSHQKICFLKYIILGILYHSAAQMMGKKIVTLDEDHGK